MASFRQPVRASRQPIRRANKAPDIARAHPPRNGAATYSPKKTKADIRVRTSAFRIATLLLVIVEVEETEEIPNCRAVDRNIGVALRRDGVGEVVAAATGDGIGSPVPLDELVDRDVIRVLVRNVAAS